MTRITITIDVDLEPTATAKALGLSHAGAIADYAATSIRTALEDAGAMSIKVEAHKTSVNNRAHYNFTGARS